MAEISTTEILKALADETRLSLVRELAATKQPVSSCDIVHSCASFLKLSQPAMSHHFSRLVDAGVLIEQKHGVEKSYVLNHRLLKSIGIDAKKL